MAKRASGRGAGRRGRQARGAGSATPSSLESALIQIESDLSEIGAQHALVGGLAVSAHATPRTTRDVDMVVAVEDDTQAEALIRALQARGYALETVIEQTATGRLATARLEIHDTLVDLLFASSGIEREITEAAQPHQLTRSLRMPIARLGHLLALKLLARDDRTRPQDAGDIRALLAEATAPELALAKEALGLIQARGFARRRRLLALFAAALRQR